MDPNVQRMRSTHRGTQLTNRRAIANPDPEWKLLTARSGTHPCTHAAGAAPSEPRLVPRRQSVDRG